MIEKKGRYIEGKNSGWEVVLCASLMFLYFYSEVEESRAGRFLDTSSGPGLLALTKIFFLFLILLYRN